MSVTEKLNSTIVHCHVGSLETKMPSDAVYADVHCHVGSLEIMVSVHISRLLVHCHVGSLERTRN